MHQTKVFDDPKEITVALAPAKARPRRWRPPGFAISILAGMLVFALFRQTILSQVGALLIVEDPLRQAIAIISLAGQTPFREIEAAQLYRQGWAPRIIIVPASATAESQALRRLAIHTTNESALSQAVLLQ